MCKTKILWPISSLAEIDTVYLSFLINKKESILFSITAMEVIDRECTNKNREEKSEKGDT